MGMKSHNCALLRMIILSYPLYGNEIICFCTFSDNQKSYPLYGNEIISTRKVCSSFVSYPLYGNEIYLVHNFFINNPRVIPYRGMKLYSLLLLIFLLWVILYMGMKLLKLESKPSSTLSYPLYGNEILNTSVITGRMLELSLIWEWNFRFLQSVFLSWSYPLYGNEIVLNISIMHRLTWVIPYMGMKLVSAPTCGTKSLSYPLYRNEIV